jgi:hypothetical protein
MEEEAVVPSTSGHEHISFTFDKLPTLLPKNAVDSSTASKAQAGAGKVSEELAETLDAPIQTVSFQTPSPVFDLPHDGRVRERKGTGFVRKEELGELSSEEDGEDPRVTFCPEEVRNLPHDGRVKLRKGTGYVRHDDFVTIDAFFSDSEADEKKVRFRRNVTFNLPHDGRVKARKATGYIQKGEKSPEAVDESSKNDQMVTFRLPSQVLDLTHDGRVKARKGTGHMKRAEIQELLDVDDHQAGEQTQGIKKPDGDGRRMRTALLMSESALLSALSRAAGTGTKTQE